ncbi:ENV2 protein, partial [Neopipo cinnamomea]|nr:ENV2 protein [Neopipo cinnamomea]
VVTPKLRENPLWNILQASYQVLNHTHPNITKHCWLCYDINPPFYEAMAIIGEIKRINSMNPTECLWNEEKRQGITMAQVSGIGNCIG